DGVLARRARTEYQPMPDKRNVSSTRPISAAVKSLPGCNCQLLTIAARGSRAPTSCSENQDALSSVTASTIADQTDPDVTGSTPDAFAPVAFVAMSVWTGAAAAMAFAALRANERDAGASRLAGR